jgi:hypothetical protein
MREYHFYVLDGQAAIQPRRISQCEDHLSALEVAQSFGAGGDFEIWQASRLVTHIDNSGQYTLTARGTNGSVIARR